MKTVSQGQIARVTELSLCPSAKVRETPPTPVSVHLQYSWRTTTRCYGLQRPKRAVPAADQLIYNLHLNVPSKSGVTTLSTHLLWMEHALSI